MLFSLTNGDITKTLMVEGMPAEKVYEWFYILKVKELNELKQLAVNLVE